MYMQKSFDLMAVMLVASAAVTSPEKATPVTLANEVDPGDRIVLADATAEAMRGVDISPDIARISVRLDPMLAMDLNVEPDRSVVVTRVYDRATDERSGLLSGLIDLPEFNPELVILTTEEPSAAVPGPLRR